MLVEHQRRAPEPMNKGKRHSAASIVSAAQGFDYSTTNHSVARFQQGQAERVRRYVGKSTQRRWGRVDDIGEGDRLLEPADISAKRRSAAERDLMFEIMTDPDLVQDDRLRQRLVTAFECAWAADAGAARDPDERWMRAWGKPGCASNAVLGASLALVSSRRSGPTAAAPMADDPIRDLLLTRLIPGGHSRNRRRFNGCSD